MKKGRIKIGVIIGLLTTVYLSGCTNSSDNRAPYKSEPYSVAAEEKQPGFEAIESAPQSEEAPAHEKPKSTTESDKKIDKSGFLHKGGIDSQKAHKEDNHDTRKKKRQTVGYYDLCQETGTSSQWAIIKAGATPNAPLTPLNLPDLTKESLSHINVLFLNSCSSGERQAQLTQALPEIVQWINQGGRLVFHGFIDNAQAILPKADELSLVKTSDESDNIEILLPDTRVTEGPRGVLTNDSLDGNKEAVQGYAQHNTLPEKSHAILSTANPDHVVTFSYCYGLGGVVYSTIPLDVAVDNLTETPLKTIKDIYAPNLISYTAHGALCR